MISTWPNLRSYLPSPKPKATRNILITPAYVSHRTAKHLIFSSLLRNPNDPSNRVPNLLILEALDEAFVMLGALAENVFLDKVDT